MATSVAGRSTVLRAMCRASTNSSPSSATRRFSLPLPLPLPPRSSNFLPRLSPTSHPPPLRLRLVRTPKRSEFPSTRPLCNRFRFPCLQAPYRSHHFLPR